MIVTRDFVNEIAKENGYEAIEVEGIPSGLAFIKHQNKVLGISRDLGSLVAFRLGEDTSSKRCMCYKPLIIDKDVMPEALEEEMGNSRLALAAIYKKPDA